VREGIIFKRDREEEGDVFVEKSIFAHPSIIGVCFWTCNPKTRNI
jgi:hypothetical protein